MRKLEQLSKIMIIGLVIWFALSCMTLGNIQKNPKIPSWNFWNVAKIVREAK